MRVPRLVVAAFVVVNLLLIAACVFALRQNVRLRGEAANYVALLTPAKGAVVPPLLGEDWKGTPQAVAYGQDPRPTLVYTFSQRCPYCQQNWRAMRSLQPLSPSRLRIVYIDTVPDLFTPQYLAETGIGQSVVLVRLSAMTDFVYDVRLVPQTILVSRDGLVQWSHAGELTSSDVSKVLSLVGRS